MKIAFFHPHMGTGGMTKVMMLLASELAKRGYDIDILTLDVPANNQAIGNLSKNLNVIKVFAPNITSSLAPLIEYLIITPPNVFFSAWPLANCILLTANIIAKANTKIIITEHSLPSKDVFNIRDNIVKVIPTMMRSLYPKADHIVAVSNTVANDLSDFIEIPRERIKVIYNPIVSDELIKLSHKKVEHPFFNKITNFIVVFVGRIDKNKRVDMLIHAMNNLKATPNIKLLVLGDGEERRNLENLTHKLNLNEKISFIGHVENPCSYIRKSNLLALCSQWEGLPTVLIEALACETPVLTTSNLESANEIFINGKHGLIVKPCSEEIAKYIKKLTNTDLALSDLIKRANLFSQAESINKYINLLD